MIRTRFWFNVGAKARVTFRDSSILAWRWVGVLVEFDELVTVGVLVTAVVIIVAVDALVAVCVRILVWWFGRYVGLRQRQG